MKPLFIFLLFPAILFLQLNSVAAKEKLTDDPKTKFSAKVDFKNWEAGVVGCSREVSDLQIFGFGTDNNGITMVLDGEPKEGTYEINRQSKHKATFGTVENRFTVGANDFGRVIITSYDSVKNQISGTFELKLTNNKTGKSVKITQGVFSKLDITTRPPMPGHGVTIRRNNIPWQLVAFGVSASKSRQTASVNAIDNEYGFNLNFPTNTSPGEYIIAENGLYSATYFNHKKKDEEVLKSRSGKLIILKNDGEVISGRFEVALENNDGTKKVSFTAGEFSLFYSND